MLSHLSLLVAGLTIAGSLSAQTPARPMRRGAATTQHMAMAAGGDWTTYGGNLWNQRYFTGTRINAANAAHLTPRFMFQTGTARLGSLETTPLVEDGVMYVTTPYNTAIAYNLKTRKQLWRYEHRLGTTIFCCGPDNRGMAIHGPHVYMGTLDARLVALDKKTGEVAWDVEVADPTFGYSITHAPLVIGNAVIVGVSGGEYGIRGHVTAYDAVTGRQLWRWYSIPAPRGDPTFDAAAPNGWFGSWTPTTPDGADLHRNITQEKSDSARNADAWQRGGGGVWMTPAYDKDLNMIFVAVGNPSPDLDGSIRPGDNLYTDAVVAIDATTGQTKWYYQTVPHDVWDLDAVSPPIVVMVGGKKAIVHAGKTGWVYVLDASNGHLIRRSKNFVPQENMFALPTAAGTRMLPGANGGAEWSPMSVDPTLQYSFVAALHQPMNYITHYAPWEKGRLWLGSAFVAIPNEPQFGIFSAINLQTGEIAWKHQVDQPMMGGALSTAGNLTFTGEGSGKFTAYNSRTGAELWHFDAGAGCNAAPMGFSMDGEDFIAVACGGNFQLNFPLGDAVIVFGLPKAVPPRR
jgi:PQQ-dependent dehydrogenase (methanol/ethanol family)